MNRSRHLAVLRRIVTSPGSPLDVDALLDRTVRSLSSLTGDELASLHLVSPDGRTLRLRGQRGLSARLRDVNLVHVPGEGLIGRVAMSGQPIALKRVTRSAHLLPAARGVVEADGIRAFACVPIRVAGRVLGTVAVGRRTAAPFTSADVRLLEATAGHVGAVLGCAPAPSAWPEETTARLELLAALVEELRRAHQSMLGWARLLRDHHAAELSVSAHGLSVLERSLRQQTALLGELQDLSHIVAGTLPCDRRPIDLVATLEAALAAWPAGDAGGAPTVELVTELASCPVLGDERRLRQVIDALLLDAVTAGGGQGRVVARLSRARDRARLAIGAAGEAGVCGRERAGGTCADDAARGIVTESIEVAIARHLVLLHGGTLDRHDAGDPVLHETVVELPALGVAADPAAVSRRTVA